MFNLEHRVGRLVELRVESPVTFEELLEFHAMLARVVKPIAGQIVICTDLAGAHVFSPQVTRRWTEIIRHESTLVQRNGVLVGEGAVFSMQVERIIREAGHFSRRAFLSAANLTAWLGEVLTPLERARLTVFLKDNAESRAKQKKGA